MAQSKSNKVEEWRNFPLATGEQRQAWWLKKQQSINLISRSDAEQSSPAQSEMLQEASPFSTGPALDTGPNLTFPRAPQMHDPVTMIPAWESELNVPSNYDLNPTLEDSRTSNAFLASNEVLNVAMAGSTEYPSPDMRASEIDRWRKYF
jgi:hypothetical protein